MSGAAGGFCPAGERWGEALDGEQGLSCPGDASAPLVPLLGVELNELNASSELFNEQEKTLCEGRG